jgi:hypothetical protein
MLDLDELKKAGVTVKKFCGMDIDGITCTGEAVGDMIVQMEDGMQVPIPVCEQHLEAIRWQFDVEDVSI